MRVRPFFWIMLVTVCASILIFAANIPAYRSVPLQARIEQISTTTSSFSQVYLRLTDSEGLPVDQASVTPHAYMPDMAMAPPLTRVQSLGQGLYLASIDLSMVGSWKIDIVAHADGFAPMKQSITLDIV
ncbi:MAG TPA: FixH family protein [Ktedonobacteraceae bacterium]|jgi:nitrogen fixation protein FixH